MAKGSQFERTVCRDLSLWWSGGKDDNVFYRTHASGGRGTARARRGKRDRHGHGDVGFVDPSGAPLLRVISFELKRGYNRLSLQDLVDCPSGRKGGSGGGANYPDWIAQAEHSRSCSGALYWALVVRRDHRRALLVAPSDLFTRLSMGRVALGVEAGGDLLLGCVALEDFFARARPRSVLEIAEGDR